METKTITTQKVGGGWIMEVTSTQGVRREFVYTAYDQLLAQMERIVWPADDVDMAEGTRCTATGRREQ